MGNQSQKSQTNIDMDKFLRENEDAFLQLPADQFIAVGPEDCTADSKCEGYQLGGEYKMGAPGGQTNPDGESVLMIDFDLSLKEVIPDTTYEIAFGFENGGYTESGSFYRDVEGKTGFRSAFEKGGLMETRTNKSVATRDFTTWTGESSLDAENKTFKATAMRSFNHNVKDRELKLGVEHKWGTVFKVNDQNRKVVAMGVSKQLRMMLTAENGFSGANSLSLSLAAGLISAHALLN